MNTINLQKRAFGILTAGAIMLAAAQASYATLTWNAADNATVKPGGPRTGTSGKAFFNVEGNNNGTNASWGAIDFNVASLGLTGPVTDVTSLSLTLTESNAAFSAPGALQFWIATDTNTSIQPGSSLFFDATQLPGGIGSQLGSLTLLGSGTFNTTGNVNSGQADVFNFTLSSAADTMLVNTLNTTGGKLRLVVTANDAAIGATWAGYSNTTYAGPQLSLSTVPEPASFAVLLLGGAALFGRRKRK